MNLNQISIPVVDVERSIDFYEKLGLKLIVKSLPHYARFECPVGYATVSLHEVYDVAKGNGVIVYFEVEDLDLTVKNLGEKGIKMDQLPKFQPWLWREARLKDLDNNQIVLFYAGENRRFPPWRGDW